MREAVVVVVVVGVVAVVAAAHLLQLALYFSQTLLIFAIINYPEPVWRRQSGLLQFVIVEAKAALA